MEYRQIIERELERRVSRNPRYSLRAFSKDLGVSPGRLSLLLNKKTGISALVAKRIAQKLGLSPAEQTRFQQSVTALHGRSRRQRESAQKNLSQPDVELESLPEDLFRVISDWPHLAILELMLIDGFELDLHKISRRIGITWAEAKAAWDRLLRLKLVQKKNQRWVSGNNSILGKSPSEAIRDFHRQLLEKAISALDSHPMSERDNSAVLLAVDPKAVPEVAAEIRAFRRELLKKFQYNEADAEVYALSAQFFQITRRSE